MNMRVKLVLLVICLALIISTAGCQKQYCWAVHDPDRPLPKVIRPGTESAQELPGKAPSDAIVLFDGKDLSQWVSAEDGGPAKWKVKNGYMEVVKETGDIQTKNPFGSCQLHVEWASPVEVKDESQGRGNSGIFLMDNYEVQVLDSYGNKTYADGQAAAIYAQKPPMVNACRKPGQWQSYDIIFHRPVFKNKKVVKQGTITVLHNGVLVQDNWQIEGRTAWKTRAKYEPHAEKLPIKLQDHGTPVRYRNIWVRELPEP
jgi:hypothetical protein